MDSPMKNWDKTEYFLTENSGIKKPEKFCQEDLFPAIRNVVHAVGTSRFRIEGLVELHSVVAMRHSGQHPGVERMKVLEKQSASDWLQRDRLREHLGAGEIDEMISQ